MRLRMRAHDDRLPVALRDGVQNLDQLANAGFLVDIFLAVRADQKIAVLLQSEASERIRLIDLRPVI